MKSLFFISATLIIMSSSAEAYASDTAPTITSATFTNHHVVIAWRAAAGDIFDKFNVRYSPAPIGALPTWQTEVIGGTGGTFTWLPPAPAPGQYAFIVEGCNHGVLRSDCTKWSQQVDVTVPKEPAPQTRTYSWGAMSAGDCRMQNASVTFNSYGGGTFNAQVKTLKTHSGDTWHATIAGLGASGATVVGLPTYDSVRMDDSHPWYSWTVDFTYDQSQFGALKSATMHHAC